MTETQNQIILSHLKSGKVITPMDALDICGSFRLSARIFELREKGWPIFCERKAVESGKIVGHYSMQQDKAWWPKE